MKTAFVKMASSVILLLLFTILDSQKANSQATDSLTHSWTSDAAIQFQLIGGLGLYYIGDWGPVSHLRIGANAFFNSSNQSGSGEGYSTYTSIPPSSFSASHNTGEPEQTSNSYQISLSGLYLYNLVEYKHALIYCGIGPMASYSWYRSTSKTPYSYISTYDTTTNISSNESINENTYKTSALGPLAIFGVRSRLLDHVSLSAEIGLSAVYQWTTQSNSFSSTSRSSPSSSSTSNSGNISHLNGWAISLIDIRIGLVIEL